MWLAITGKAQAGKDTVASYLVSHYGFTRVAFADHLRKMAYEINPLVDHKSADPYGPLGMRDPVYIQELVDELGWEEAKKHAQVRRFLQRLGTEGVRDNVGQDFWVLVGEQTALNVDGSVVFTDARFDNELEMIRFHDGIRVHVDRDVESNAGDHASEAGFTDDHPDHILDNNGSLDELYAAIDAVMRSYSRV